MYNANQALRQEEWLDQIHLLPKSLQTDPHVQAELFVFSSSSQGVHDVYESQYMLYERPYVIPVRFHALSPTP